MLIKISLTAEADRDSTPVDYLDPETLENRVKEEIAAALNSMDIVDIEWHFVDVENDL
jgi:hypothetical protein